MGWMEKPELRLRKDRYNPDNVYRIYIDLNRFIGTKWVSFKDKQTGEVTKGVFVPDNEVGCIRIRNGRIRFQINAIPVKGLTCTHILVVGADRSVDCHLGRIGAEFRKPTVGYMYVLGETTAEDREKIERYERQYKYKLRIKRHK